ncbi:phosphonate ABC transporter, permease protein PhnE [Pseudorhizobium endolithicum]|uniref:Phosphonate ABC transporter, permease protein PhnE n=1 Tax=Pseudorhizobium endolithicum TaxID=1191678 RepID=A0ABN7JJM3_9HYPH|nr:phosphonate ABC transporter, permease protein PhnE [Pseudorhizobium endolithicum]CAD7033158.1 phosphonate ABC transporter, permease protein PhnE [Pseudorhizobium endolithicum]
MTILTTAEMDALAARHPDILHRSAWQRFRLPIIAAAVVAYFIFAWWFFAVGKVVGTANWGLAGNYLADWISYEIRPDIEVAADGSMQITYPRFDPIGPNPNPDWLQAKRETVTRTVNIAPASGTSPSSSSTSSFSFMAPAPTQQQAASSAAPTTETRTEEVVTEAVVQMGASRTIDILPDRVVLTRGSETVTLTLDRDADRVLADGALPEWAEQRSTGGRVTAYFGFSGWAEISADRVRIRKRFLGWENFFFDTNSAFFGKSASEVASLIVSGERLDPAQSNLSLAWSDILYNPSWQHLDVWTKLLQTIVMAFIGTLFAMIVAFPLSFIAARNIFRNRPVNQLTKRLFDFLRSVDMLIWALFFTRAFGPGPLAGISAIFLTDTGTLGKLYAEALENIDDKQREGVRSVGAPPATVQRYGVVPQVMPVFVSQALYFWESNTRSATIIGAVGAGGIGLKLWEAMRTNSDWENVAYMVLLILLVVFLFDGISNALRSRLVGRER